MTRDTSDGRRGEPTSRRTFFARSGALGTALLVARVSGAQDTAGPIVPAPAGSSESLQESGSNLGPMDQGAAKSVRRPPKPGSSAKISVAERDAVEHQIRCQCGCTLDVYTCRTTDFACEVSPAMHRDVMALVDGGYDAREIIAAFRETYGDRALMAPTREGFNLVGWAMPFTALAAGGAVIAVLVRRWSRRAAAVRAAERPVAAGTPVVSVNATAEELARIDAAVRGSGG
jgi:cytochrome c-type biogenesis protein CcmH